MDIKKAKKEALSHIKKITKEEELRSFEKSWLGPKGKIRSMFKSLKSIDEERRKNLGQEINTFKKEIARAISNRKQEIKKEEKHFRPETEWLDITTPAKPISVGRHHPITIVLQDIVSIFQNLGFSVTEGPEIEDEWHNFDALNIPPDHPARDMWDTFWLNLKLKNQKQNLLLRTHTSPSQIRYLMSRQPPFKIISPGKVYRFEAIDASHDIEFTQLEIMVVDKKVSLANLIDIAQTFLKEFFKRKDLKTRFRPSYYPFVEPGIDVEIFFNNKWLEVAGAGMVHPNIFKNTGLNPRNWQGFAFGFGVNRLAMIKYNIPDIRLFHSADLRFLNQF